MNYPIWDIPSPGLLIAFIAIVHVFISHFAVGGGLFLVLAERKARRERDDAFLEYVERHSKFFALLTLVAGTLTGVGIWFTIALVHPSATASLIAGFVWGWAIEWTFFVTEIAAALVYAYGWRRLPPATHMRVGWIYFGAAWLSLAVINGILTFMLTPGTWLVTRGFWDGVLNPTYLPSLIARTAGAVLLAGVYALMTASWMTDAYTKARLARYAGLGWVLPAAIVMPLSIAWLLAAASGAGVPVAQAFGATGSSLFAIGRAALAMPASGYPIAQRAVIGLILSCSLLFITTAIVVAWRPRTYGRLAAAFMMAGAFVALGASEFMREDLRKPYVIGGYMFVNGVRVPPAIRTDDPFVLDAVATRGVAESSLWSRPIAKTDNPTLNDIARGHEVFRLSCSMCHTLDGYLAVRPLVRDITVPGAAGLIGRFARPINKADHPIEWSNRQLHLASWRGRMMPPFAGSPEDRRVLAVYLASLGGMTPEHIARSAENGALGARLFDERCSVCHGTSADFPMPDRIKGRVASEFYALLGRLPELNDAMEPFDGNEAERRALADYLPTLGNVPEGGSR